ncbi:MAG: two-component system, OmpR family, response regulator MprA [Thermoleophilaceae bacterium]|nr:two-component system, OmpR family, response regulator MprA [Thermoleophilaceae bacterium]
MHVLVTDDERSVRSAVRRALTLEGYRVTEAEDGARALDVVATDRPDAIVLDVMMPELDGYQVCRTLRDSGDSTPILMLTARDEIDQRVKGLDSGADDYLVTPVALEELLARLRALIRRSAPDEEGILRFAELELDLNLYEARVSGSSLKLTRTEFSLLELLMRHPRQVLPRSMINERVWGYDFGPASNSLGVYVGYLRRKLQDHGADRLIQTVRGVGYILREP